MVASNATTLYRVVTVKHGQPTFVAVDGGMGDNLEVALYQQRFEAALVSRVGGASRHGGRAALRVAGTSWSTGCRCPRRELATCWPSRDRRLLLHDVQQLQRRPPHPRGLRHATVRPGPWSAARHGPTCWRETSPRPHTESRAILTRKSVMSIASDRRRCPCRRTTPSWSEAATTGWSRLRYLAKQGLRTVVLEKRDIVGGAAVSEHPFGPDYTVTSLSYVVSLLPPTLVRDLNLDRHGYHVYPQGPYFAPHSDGTYLQLPSDHARRREQIAKFSDKDADAIDRWDAWLGPARGVMGPMLTEIPPKVGLAPPGATWPARPTCCASSAGVDTRMAVDLTRLLTMSVADLVEDYFESDALPGVLAVSGVIGTWAGPRSAGTAYVMAHHHIGDIGDGQIGAWGFPRGGMGGVSKALASAARSFGVEIRTGAAVARITVADGARHRGRARVG